MENRRKIRQLLYLIISCVVCIGLTITSTEAANVFPEEDGVKAATANITINGIDIGYAAGQYFSTTGYACKCHGRHTCGEASDCTCKKVSGCCQCYGFALWCENKMYGCNDVSSPSKFTNMGSISSSNMTATNLKNLISSLSIGAHIRTGGSSPHSMILIAKSNTGFTVLQANGSNNNEYSGYYNCRIGTATYTWSSYINSTYGSRGIAFAKQSKSSPVPPDPDPEPQSFNVPLKCFTVSTGNVTTYTSATGSSVSGYITGSTDECTISAVYKNGRVKVTYPLTNGGTKTAYANLTDFISSAHQVSNYNYSVSSSTTTYRRSDLSQSYGLITSTDVCTVVGELNGKLQIIYPLSSGGYKLGWIDGKGSDQSIEVDSRYPVPITAYTISTGNVTTYSSINGSSTGYITGSTDQCTISEIYTNGWCKVSYPISGGTKTAYTQFSNFLDTSCSVTPSTYKTNGTVTAYQRKNLNDAFGSIWSTDSCKLVASSGNLKQIIYPLDSGGYKMGWISVETSSGQVNWPVPVKAYIDSATNQATVYEEINQNSGYGIIFVDDECSIDEVYTNGWCKVTYPVSSGTKTGYVPLSVFVPNQVTAYNSTASKQITSYKKSNMESTYGYASQGDALIIVGKSGSKTQLIYPLDSGGHKLAWVYSSDLTKNLIDISVSTKPSKLSYVEGESLDTSGLVIQATYSDNSTATVTNYSVSGYTSTPGVKTINVSYTEGEITKTTSFSVTVNQKKPVSLSIPTKPSKITYEEGETTFDFSDMVVKVTYDNNTTAIVTDYELFGLSDTAGTKTITVQYTENNVTVTSTFNIVITVKTYIVLYLASNGSDVVISNIPDSQIKIRGIDLTLSSQIPIREGYLFKGWSASEQANIVNYIPGDIYSGDSDITLYAVWAYIDMDLPDSLQRIEEEAFRNIGEIVIRIPESVQYIAENAFDNTVTVVVKSGTYAESRCRELGLTVITE